MGVPPIPPPSVCPFWSKRLRWKTKLGLLKFLVTRGNERKCRLPYRDLEIQESMAACVGILLYCQLSASMEPHGCPRQLLPAKRSRIDIAYAYAYDT